MTQRSTVATRLTGRRIFAALWVLCAAFALQVAAVTEGVATRQTARAVAGKVSVPAGREPEQTLSRTALRSGKLVDLRFFERLDGKQAVGGGDPVLLPSHGRYAYALARAASIEPIFEPWCARSAGHSHRARAPPLARV